MYTKKQIATIFSNARELVRLGQPRPARTYVIRLLECALETYKGATSVLQKAKTAAFMDHWIAVSRELYDKGVTDFVLESFGLPTKAAVKTPARKKPKSSPKKGEEPVPAQENPAQESPAPDGGSAGDDEIDFSGLIEETRETQGWGADVFEKNKSAVAEIHVAGNGKLASGTGFILSGNGYLLTNDHVVFDSDNGTYYPKITMNLCGGSKRHKLEVLFSDAKSDIALCKFNAEEVGKCGTVTRIADYSALAQGAECLLIGNGFGMGLAPGLGVVRFTRDSDGNLVHTAPSNPGDSGGPLFNRRGECVGINKSRTVKVNEEAAEGFANATPMDTIEKFLAKWCGAGGIAL